MEMNTKYTADGKKVLVVGKLNNTETIVQEIFVGQNGQEIPSGENFVVKTLHDAPAISWKLKNLLDLEQRYEREKKEWEKKIEEQRLACNRAFSKAKLKAAYLLNFTDNSNEEQLNLLKSFLSGEITHVFVDNYSPDIVLFDDVDSYDDDYRWGPKELKLISLFGDSKGNLMYRINEYKDGSGNWCDVYPARSREEALKFAQEVFDDKCKKYLRNEITYLDVSKWEKIEGLNIPEAVRSKYRERKNSDILKNIQNMEAQLEKLKMGLIE